MVIFHSYVKLPEDTQFSETVDGLWFSGSPYCLLLDEIHDVVPGVEIQGRAWI